MFVWLIFSEDRVVILYFGREYSVLETRSLEQQSVLVCNVWFLCSVIKLLLLFSKTLMLYHLCRLLIAFIFDVLLLCSTPCAWKDLVHYHFLQSWLIQILYFLCFHFLSKISPPSLVWYTSQSHSVWHLH